jgi:hypothetical protein
MERGYPADADIQDYLEDRGLEVVPENAVPYTEDFRKFVWGIINQLDWARTLAVYCATSTTFNIAGGKYVWKGEIKTYTPGSSIDPTDNDTTYIWVKPDNTIGSVVDGTGWPATEHIKLAEIDVDPDGVITAVRDRRADGFLQYLPKTIIEAHTADDTLTLAENGSIHTNLGASGAVKLTLPASSLAGTIFTFAVQTAQELRVDPGSKTIRDTSGQTADKYKVADAIGECLTLVADSNGDWMTIAKYGTWTEES